MKTTANNPIYAILQAREASPYSDADTREAVHLAVDAGEPIAYALAVSLARSPTEAELDTLRAERELRASR